MSFFHFSAIQSCILCHDTTEHSILCPDCNNDLLSLHGCTKHLCPTCFAYSEHSQICHECQNNPPPIHAIWASMRYAPPVPAMLHQWKHLRQTAISNAFFEIMSQTPPPWLTNSGINGILAMPISRERRLSRGFNQSDELATYIATTYDFPLLSHDTVYRHHRPPQSTLGQTEREHNILNVFELQNDLSGMTILLIDDVMTTGNSLYELAHTLQKGGAKSFIWTLAKNQN